MGSPATQYRQCKTEAGLDPVVAVVAAMADPTVETDGVAVVNKEFACVRIEATGGVGTFDVKLWRLFTTGQGESWILDAGFGTVSMNGGAAATARKFVKVEVLGAVRLYAQCTNFAAAGSANVRINAGG
jgi:hypothetical protein